MSRFFTLGSSSKGNSAYVGTSKYGLLIDLGISAKACETALAIHDIDIKSLRGILITHEHIDHIKGLKVFLKKHQMPVYSSPLILNYLIEKDLVPPSASLREIQNNSVEIDNFKVQSFETKHDSLESYGYKISLSGSSDFCILTDNGTITTDHEKALENCDLVMIESNYDKQMLSCGGYPYMLKRRIDSNCGHLSNEQCSEAVLNSVLKGSKRFVLAHLSKDNNYPALAFQTTLSNLTENGLIIDEDFTLTVAPEKSASELIVF